MRLLPTGNTPRWVILAVDMLLCILALAIAYAIRFDFVQPDPIQIEKEWVVLKFALPFYILVRFVSFYISKTYSGIIRFTSTQDAKRMFITLGVGTLFFGIASVIRHTFMDGFFLLPLSILFLEFILSYFLLISMRVSIKLLYLEQNKSRGATKNIVIYGAGDMGMATKKILEQDTEALFNIIGFIDDNPTLQGKYLERTPVKGSSYLRKWTDKKEIDSVIIAIKNPNPASKSQIIDLCLDLNIDLLTVPPLEQWMNGGFTSKQIKKVKIEDLLGRKEIQLSIDNITSFIQGKTIMITGGAGSIGSEIARQVLKFNPKKLILLDHAESPLYDLSNELRDNFGDANFELLIADVSNEKRMKKAFQH
jgi:FlaA1/EpsC-like NDP-sugar epimerase